MAQTETSLKTPAPPRTQEFGGTGLEIFNSGIAKITLPQKISDQCLTAIQNIRAALEKSPLGVRGIEVSCSGHDRISVSLLASLLSLGRSYGGSTVVLCDLAPSLREELTREKYHRLFELRSDSGTTDQSPPDRERTNTLHNELRAVGESSALSHRTTSSQSPPGSRFQCNPADGIVRTENQSGVTFSFRCRDLAAEPAVLIQLRRDLLATLTARRIVIDLGNVQRVGVAFVGVMMQCVRAAQAKSSPVKLELIGVDPDIYDFLKYHRVPGLPKRKAA